MSPSFNLQDYQPVEERIETFWKDHPKGRITTEIVRFAQGPGERWVVKALVYREGEAEPAGTGHAFEVDGQGNVNKTSALENGETSAIGRALAQMGYAAKGKRPSREEMSKSQRVESAHAEPSAASDTSRSNLPAAAPPAEPSSLIDRFGVKPVMDEVKKLTIERRKGERVPFKVEHLADVPDDVLAEVSRRLQDRLPV